MKDRGNILLMVGTALIAVGVGLVWHWGGALIVGGMGILGAGIMVEVR